MKYYPKDIIEHDREMILWDSESFRDGVWADIMKGRWSCIKYLWEAKIITRINDYKTNKLYDKFNPDRSHWVFIKDGDFDKDIHEKWLKEGNIKYDNNWMVSSGDYAHYYFYNPDDAVLFKLTWT